MSAISHDKLVYYLGNDDYIFDTNESIESDLNEYENSIRADAIRKFAEWLEKKDLLTLWHGDDDNETLSAEKVLNMYEKEQTQ